MNDRRICHESASTAGAARTRAALVGEDARRKRVTAWAGEMKRLPAQAAEDLAVRFDQMLELEPYLSEEEAAEIIATAAEELGLMDAQGVAGLLDKLPVFPSAARDVLHLAAEPDLEPDDVERLAKSDQVLAGRTIAAANSCLWGGLRRITDLSRAIMHLGTDTTRNVLMGAAMRAVFGDGPAASLWTHSTGTAQSAERLARIGGYIPGGQGFLAGLIHDVGRLAFVGAPAEAAARVERLAEAGCPLAAVERVVFGAEHGSLGAEILDRWKFAEEMQRAVRFHHWPERGDSSLAYLIYAAEFRLDDAENLPSLARLQSACAAIGVGVAAVTGLGFENARDMY